MVFSYILLYVCLHIEYHCVTELVQLHTMHVRKKTFRPHTITAVNYVMTSHQMFFQIQLPLYCYINTKLVCTRCKLESFLQTHNSSRQLFPIRLNYEDYNISFTCQRCPIGHKLNDSEVRNAIYFPYRLLFAFNISCWYSFSFLFNEIFVHANSRYRYLSFMKTFSHHNTFFFYRPFYLPYLTGYKTHQNFSWVNQEKSTNIKRDEINIMNIINDNTFNLHNRLLNNDNRYMNVTLNSKLIGVAGLLISADY